MLKIKEAIVVEGRYDKNTLSQLVDTLIVDIGGFAVFKSSERVALLRRLAAACGLVIFTDGDGAGFVIRNYLKGALPKEGVKHAYIPDIAGKERRKRKGSSEGKLGVEGMSPEIIYDSLRRAGVTVLDEEASQRAEKPFITKGNLYEDGLTGGAGSAQLRKILLRQLELPEHLSTNALVEVLNTFYTVEEYHEAVRKAKHS
jgi:Small primase-like proteins (Toprim domain)